LFFPLFFLALILRAFLQFAVSDDRFYIFKLFSSHQGGRRRPDRMADGFISTYAINACNY
jgi:hypothetical protein